MNSAIRGPWKLLLVAGLLSLAACGGEPGDTTAPTTAAPAAKTPFGEPAPKASPGSGMSAIRAAGDAWLPAFVAGDASRLGALYADSAVLMPESAPAVSGSSAIGAFLAASSAKHSSAGYKLAMPDGVEVAAGDDLGYRAGTYVVTDSGGAEVDRGKWLQVWTNEGGEWRILKDIRNSDGLPLWIADETTE